MAVSPPCPRPHRGRRPNQGHPAPRVRSTSRRVRPSASTSLRRRARDLHGYLVAGAAVVGTMHRRHPTAADDPSQFVPIVQQAPGPSTGCASTGSAAAAVGWVARLAPASRGRPARFRPRYLTSPSNLHRRPPSKVASGRSVTIMPYRAPCADNPRAFVPGFTEHAMCDPLRLRQQRARS